MKHINPVVLFIILFILTSCQSSREDWSGLPDVMPLRSLEKTEFVPALESPNKKCTVTSVSITSRRHCYILQVYF